MSTTNLVDGSADISQDGIYRYSLGRTFEHRVFESRTCVFIMLNPSTADAFKNDPTITRCINMAKSWDCDSLCVLNLFALRSTDPKVLKDHPDPVGPGNDIALKNVLTWRSSLGHKPLVICAWGVGGKLHRRGDEVYDMIMRYHGEPHYLDLTKGGEPRHPLYLPRGLTPTLWV